MAGTPLAAVAVLPSSRVTRSPVAYRCWPGTPSANTWPSNRPARMPRPGSRRTRAPRWSKPSAATRSASSPRSTTSVGPTSLPSSVWSMARAETSGISRDVAAAATADAAVAEMLAGARRPSRISPTGFTVYPGLYTARRYHHIAYSSLLLLEDSESSGAPDRDDEDPARSPVPACFGVIASLRALLPDAGAATGEALSGLGLRLGQELKGVDIDFHLIHLLSFVGEQHPRPGSGVNPGRMNDSGSHRRDPPLRRRRRKATTPARPVLKSATTAVLCRRE